MLVRPRCTARASPCQVFASPWKPSERLRSVARDGGERGAKQDLRSPYGENGLSNDTPVREMSAILPATAKVYGLTLVTRKEAADQR